MWSETLNKLCNEAERLSQILHLSEKDTQKDQKEEAVILEHGKSSILNMYKQELKYKWLVVLWCTFVLYTVIV